MNNTTFSNLLKKMAPEFGIVNESLDPTQLADFKQNDPEAKAKRHVDLEKSIIGQIDRSKKLDEVDTVTFGLETDDNKIVKVYINAEQAIEFEKELSQKLGEIDDIEEVLNELSKKFEIVDVEWPEEGDEEDEEDVDTDDEPTGGESMDPRVYKKDKKFDPAVKNQDDIGGMQEHLSYGEKITLTLTESMSSIEQRLSTPSQLLVYHAILALGIPEVALTKSPYRSAIVQSIKEQALEINKNPQLKLALKNFVRYAIDAAPHSLEKNEEQEKEQTDKNPEVKVSEKPSEKKVVSKVPEKSLSDKEEKPLVKESLESGNEFWTAVQTILKHVMVNEMSFERLTSCAAWNRLVARSSTRVASKYIGQVEQKMNDLIKRLPVSEKEAVTESMTVVELENLLISLFEFADPDPAKKYANNLINAPQLKQFIASAKSALTQKFSGAARTRVQLLLTALAQKSDKKEAVVEEAVELPISDKDTWVFKSTNKGLSISHGEHLKMIIDEENSELLSKGITNKRALVVKDIAGAKFTFSPRGVIVKVKVSGTNAMCEMSPKDVSALMTAVAESVAGKKKKEEEEE